MPTQDAHPSAKHSSKQSVLSTIFGILLGLIVVIGIVVWHNHHSIEGTPAMLTQTYCSKTGKVCLSYPKSWRLSVDSSAQAMLTDPATGTTVLYSPQLISDSDPCGAGSCLFKTLSAVISNGFSNADDVAGVFQYGNGTFVPEYFLTSTKQLLNEGLGSVGTTTDVKQTSLDLGFTNGSLAQLDQSLEVSPPSSASFKELSTAKNWLSSPTAKTAIAIVGSARPQT